MAAHVQCPACGASPLQARFRLHDYCIGACPHCGLYVNETFYVDPKFRKSLFSAEYYEKNVAFDHRQQAWRDDPSIPIYSRFLDLVEQQIGKGAILDVGCAFGNFLKLAETRGWRPFGVDLSAYSATAARENWGYPIQTGDIENCSFPAESFDLITFWDVIEHVGSPANNLQKSRQLLRAGGRVLLATDNAGGLIAGLGSAIYGLSGGRWSYPVRKFFIRFNSVYFTFDQLRGLLERTGFRLIHAEQIDYPLSKLNVSCPERCLVALLYAAGRLLRRRSQFLVIAEAI